jgi:AraC family transcriptional regulator
LRIAAEVERAVVERERNGTSGSTTARVLATGDGWTVADVVCTSGPQDRRFEECHDYYSIALVASGTFQYRSKNAEVLLTPGSLMLGNPGQCFECGHEHAVGDRCLAFWYEPEFFERIAAEAGVSGGGPAFGAVNVPSIRDLSPLVSRAYVGLLGSSSVDWHELGLSLAGHALRLTAGLSLEDGIPASAGERVTRAVRLIERDLDGTLTLDRLAHESQLSQFHFLRTFERITGLTPHRYILRARLREAAMRLDCEDGRVLDIALDSGFGDVSNFNRAFRAEFGMSPRAYRQTLR